MQGRRRQQDQHWGDEYTEYVLRCTRGSSVMDQSKTTWLVGGRYNDFSPLHHEQELKKVETELHALIEKLKEDEIKSDLLQEMIQAVQIVQPRVAAFLQIGARVDMELVPRAMQL